jgi:hypothetical protein
MPAAMRYDEYPRLGYGIGSGAVESAHKQVVHARTAASEHAGVKQEPGACSPYRCCLLNDRWAMLDPLRMVSLAP